MITRFSRNLYLAIHGTLPPRRLARKAKRGPARDTRYLAWIRTLRCAACGASAPCEAAHTGRDGGKAIKASDYSAIPLCHRCHRTGVHSYHAGKVSFAAYWCIDYDALVQKYNALWAQLQGVMSSGRRG